MKKNFFYYLKLRNVVIFFLLLFSYQIQPILCETFKEVSDTVQQKIEFTRDGNSILERRLLEYDQFNRLTAIFIDNGMSENIHEMEGVTDRHALIFQYGTNEAFARPEKIEEKHFSLPSGPFITTRSLVYAYDSQGNIQTKQIFDPNGLLLSSIIFSYDNEERLIKETDEFGISMQRSYSSEGYLLEEIILGRTSLLQQNIYAYDVQGKLLAIDSIDDQGKIHSQTLNHNQLSKDTPQNSSFFGYLWKGAKEIASSLSQILGNFKEKFSYTHYMQEEWEPMTQQFFDKSYLQFGGYYLDPVDSGHSPYGKEKNDKVRITLINGILNVRDHFNALLKFFSASHGDHTIHYVFRPTEGWTKDLLTSTLSKSGYISPYAKLLAKKWKDLIQEMGGVRQGGKIIHYAHSIGATDTYMARNLVTAEEKQMIHVITLGSPTMIPKDSGFASAINYVSKRDGVCLLDPIGYVQGYFHKNSQIEWVGSSWGIPLIDHTLYTDSYGEAIKVLGAQFLENHP